MDPWTLGLAFILVGILMLLIEAVTPGAFIIVPATALIVIGMIGVAFPQIFFTIWTPIIGIVVAAGAGAGAIMMYRRIGRTQRPMSTSIDSLVGKRGVVVREIIPDSTKGKVKIDNQVWSAMPASAERIPPRVQVEVVRSEGVHVIVRKLD